MNDVTSKPTLVENEAIVQAGLATFVEVGLALARIRDDHQYEIAGYDRFEDYLSDRWSIGRSHAYRLIDAAAAVELVSPMGDTDTPAPASERVAREIVPVAKEDPEEAAALWQDTVDQHGPEPTAEQVAAVRDERAAPEPGEIPNAAHDDPPPDAPSQPECVDCGNPWNRSAHTVDVRCPDCRHLNQLRTEAREHFNHLIGSERGARVVEVALAAAHAALAMQPRQAGHESFEASANRLYAAPEGNEKRRQTLLVRHAGTSLLWASEITGAIDA